MADMHRQEVYCGQCFEEFYGQEYCQNLRKDLEKLKDEYYDSDSQRFWTEWVAPTFNLLRRLTNMSFPMRNKDCVLVHLYNPVDSMAMGEMHFQVGRKSPGTLTLKYTKQNTAGNFVIQPRTLDTAEELGLSLDTLAFFDTIRDELKEPNALQVLVLMTDSCKLQRQSAKVFFAKPRSERFMDQHVSGSREPSLGHSSTFSNPHVQGANLYPWGPTSLHVDRSIRPSLDGSFPLSLCVKNYVSYSSRPSAPEVSIHGAQPFGQTRQIPRKASLTVRQVSTTTCHSEPEESDETQELRGRASTFSASEITRRVSDTKLWDAPAKTASTSQQQLTRSPQMPRSQTRVTEDYAGENSQVSPMAFPRSYQNGVNYLKEPMSEIRRHSEPKIYQVEEYCISGQPKSSEKVSRTSLTDEYVSEQNKSSGSSGGSGYRLETSHSSSRTDLVDSYIGENVSSSSSESRSRTSSLDAYIGEQTSRNPQQSTTHLNYRYTDSAACDNTKTATFPFQNVLQQQRMTIEPSMGDYPHFNPNRRHMIESWMQQQPPNRTANDMLMPGMESSDMSLLSQTSFPSWASHRDYKQVAAASPLIPLVVQNINRGEYQSFEHLKSNASISSS
ncbi:hypothetical protein CHUAL_009764 [Chamberlinius hualienensis]